MYVSVMERKGIEKGIKLGRTEGRAEGIEEGNLQGFVNACRDFGASRDEAVARVARMFNLSEADARAEVDRYWPA